MRLIVINGPNLNLLGTREPEIYGSETLTDLERQWRHRGSVVGVGVDSYQSNHEGEIIDAIQAARGRYDGIVINAAALTHYSYAIYDALVAVDVPAVEVHISDVSNREEWRRHSVISPAVDTVIYGRGSVGYLDAINHLWARSTMPSSSLTYGPDPDQVIDLRVPPAPKGAVVLLHGGFWRSVWSRDIMDPLSVMIAQEGWATANVEYRRGHGSFVNSTADVAAAVGTTSRALADLDTNVPMIIAGHSAGGYLAVRAVSDDRDIPAVGALALGPVLDLARMSAFRTDDDPVAAFLGAGRSVDAELWERASLSGEPHRPVVVLHGGDDAVVPPEHSEGFADRPGFSIRQLEGVDHFDVIDPWNQAFVTVMDSLEDLRNV